MIYGIKGVVKPPYGVPTLQRDRPGRQVKLPPAIRAFAWICFLRSAFNFLAGCIVWFKPESTPAQFLAATFGSRIKLLPPLAEFILLTVVFAWFGWRWIARDWRIRWICMFLSGAVAARTLTLIAVDYASAAHGRVIQPDRETDMLLSAMINILICAYLAFYPGIGDAFKETS